MPHDAVPSEENQRQPTSSADTTFFSESPPSIVIADADTSTTAVLEAALGALGPEYPVIFFPDGADVLDHLQEQARLREQGGYRPGLLLLDLKLPVIDGLQVLQWLATFPELRPRHVLVLSRVEEDEAQDRAWALGADGCITKPLVGDGLHEAVESILEMVQVPTSPELPSSVM